LRRGACVLVMPVVCPRFLKYLRRTSSGVYLGPSGKLVASFRVLKPPELCGEPPDECRARTELRELGIEVLQADAGFPDLRAELRAPLANYGDPSSEF
jgi:hypothetical protein